MTKGEPVRLINQQLSRVLKHARQRSGMSIMKTAVSLGISEEQLTVIEARPVQVACCDLFRLIKHYGPEVENEAMMVLSSPQADNLLIGMFRHLRAWGMHQIQRNWRIIVAVIVIRFLIDWCGGNWW